MPGSPTPRVWFITGSSQGFGREFARAALEAGDKVVATARDPRTVADLVERHGPEQVLTPALDVTDPAAVGRAVEEALATFGRLDVVVNNAGYGLRGAVEEVTDAQIRRQMETNFFGALALTRAVLPRLRTQRSGHLIQISSVGGVVAFARLGIYHASKWALEAVSESLALEVAPFGVKVTIIEPGGFDTHWNNQSMDFAEPMSEYTEVLGAVSHGSQSAGDPRKSGAALLEIVNSPEPPLRVIWGNGAYDRVVDTYGERLATWAEWEQAARAMDFDQP